MNIFHVLKEKFQSLKEKFLSLDPKKRAGIIAGAVAVVVILVALLTFALLPKKQPAPEPTATPKPTPTATPSPTPEPTPEPASIPIDFASWQATYPDVYAWLYVPGTSVNYPVLQSATDDSYYLYHNLDGSRGYPGCVYTESLNSKDFNDMHTVLYGHNMHAGYKYKGIDGTMFRSLHKFEDGDFFHANRYFYVYLPNEVLTYEIFAAYTYDNRHLLYSYALDQEGVFQEYLNNVYLQKKGHIREDAVRVHAADKIVTLLTCTGNSDTRWLVVGVLREREPGVYQELPADSVSKAAVSVTTYSGQ